MATSSEQYVLGFLFDEDFENVVLIKKEKPNHPMGWNGLGGKIETGESPEEAMMREFHEEAGADVPLWRLFCVMIGSDWRVECFSSVTDSLSNVRQMEEEMVRIFSVKSVINGCIDTVSNVPFLIQMAKNQMEDPNFQGGAAFY